MSRREDLDNAIWDDPDFEALSANATLLYLWSFTNPRCGMAGMYKVSHRGMTQSKVPLEALPATLDELKKARFAFYEDSILWVRTRVKHLRSRSPQMARSIANDVTKVSADHPLRAHFLAEYGSVAWLRDALNRTYDEPTGNLSENPIGKPYLHTLSRPSLEGPGQGEGQVVKEKDSSTTNSEGKTNKVELPDDFPDDLRPHLKVIYRVLCALAKRHNAKAIAPLSLAAVVMGHAHKPLVRGAYDFSAWADGQGQRRKDVVSGYRNWLDRADDLAGYEQLGANGLPAAGSRLSPVKENASSMLRDMFRDTTEDQPIADATIVEDAA